MESMTSEVTSMEQELEEKNAQISRFKDALIKVCG